VFTVQVITTSTSPSSLSTAVAHCSTYVSPTVNVTVELPFNVITGASVSGVKTMKEIVFTISQLL
jgi:hypothetical protein